MNFTNEELEKTMEEHKIAGEVNQEIVKRIHLMFGGEYYEINYYQCQNLIIKLYNGGIMYIDYNADQEAFVFAAPGFSSKYINHWKLKKLIKVMKNVLVKDKNRKVKMNMKKIDEDFV